MSSLSDRYIAYTIIDMVDISRKSTLYLIDTVANHYLNPQKYSVCP
jgi:hypothetical protein